MKDDQVYNKYDRRANPEAQGKSAGPEEESGGNEEKDVYINTIFEDKDYFFGEEYF